MVSTTWRRKLMEGFAALRADQAAAVERDVQLQPDAALLDITGVARDTGHRFATRIGEPQAVVVALAVTRHGVECWCMTRTALA